MEEGEEGWSRMGEEVVAWRRTGEVEEAVGKRMDVEVGVYGRQMGEEVGAWGEGEVEVSERSLGAEGEATGKTSEVVAVEEGMTTAEVGAAEGRSRWGEVGEAAPPPLQHCRWPRRSTESPFSLGVSGSPGSD